MQRYGTAVCLLSMALVMGAAPAADIRPAAVAGSWYPGEAASLRDYLRQLLEAAIPEQPPPGRVRALIAPHAGYVFSGATAASAYALVRGLRYRRVIVLGPAHRAAFHGLSVADVGGYATPLGNIDLDSEALATVRASGLTQAHPSAHQREHSIEMQLPLLQQTLAPGWRLLPILVGDMDADDYARAAALLKPLWDEQTLLVVSSDFAHYGPRFGYLPFPHDTDTAQRLERLDGGALERIVQRDAEGFLRYQAQSGITVCGYRAIAILLAMLPSALEPSIVNYTTSGALTGDYHNSVSYAAIAFVDPSARRDESAATPLDGAQMRLLHDLARHAVEFAVQPQASAPLQRIEALLAQMPMALKQPGGAFVTLQRDGRLRGCIGYILTHKPLYAAVLENAINAALRDGRFPPLEVSELEGLEVEVSVLTTPRTIASAAQYKVSRDGIILRKDGRGAVFLPEVAARQGWSREQALRHLSRKAGLPDNAWKQGAVLQVFHTQKYVAPLHP